MRQRLVPPIQVALVATLAYVAAPMRGHAWEGSTTHAGLTEQAAQSAELHNRLVRLFGDVRGLYATLTIPPNDAPGLFATLRTMSPSGGFVPDTRGKLPAVGWLTAGSVIADATPRLFAQHFYNPVTKTGISGASLRPDRGLLAVILPGDKSAELPSEGMAAPQWVSADTNPFSVNAFMSQYQRSLRARTTAERRRHRAAMLIAAGALLHVLQDMASPSHVRDDLRAHTDQIGNDRYDRGSRFEELASILYGRLGVPAANQSAPPQRTIGDYFSNKAGTGLADVTARSWFSRGTLPREIRVNLSRANEDISAKLAASLRRPKPALPDELDLVAARTPTGAALRSRRGICQAVYRVNDSRLQWSIPDDCAAEQLAVLLPQAAGHSAALLSWLFRGELAWRSEKGGLLLRVAGHDLAPGRVELFWDDKDGVRRAWKTVPMKDGKRDALITRQAIPPGARTVAALYRGRDSEGAAVVAAATLPLPSSD